MDNIKILIGMFAILIFLAYFIIRQFQKEKLSKRSFILFIVLILIANIGLSFFAVLGTNNSMLETEQSTDTKTEKVATDDQMHVGDNLSVQGALRGLKEIFQAFEKTKDEEYHDMPFDKRGSAMIDEFEKQRNYNIKKSPYVTQEALDLLYLKEPFNTDEFYFLSTQVMLATCFTLDGDYSPLVSTDALDQYVFFDKEHQVASVPLDIFTGDRTFISFDLIYDNGIWKLIPFSAINTTQLIANAAITIEDLQAQQSAENTEEYNKGDTPIDSEQPMFPNPLEQSTKKDNKEN